MNKYMWKACKIFATHLKIVVKRHLIIIHEMYPTYSNLYFSMTFNDFQWLFQANCHFSRPTTNSMTFQGNIEIPWLFQACMNQGLAEHSQSFLRITYRKRAQVWWPWLPSLKICLRFELSLGFWGRAVTGLRLSTTFPESWHDYWKQYVNTLRSRRYGRRFADDTFKCILNHNVRI